MCKIFQDHRYCQCCVVFIDKTLSFQFEHLLCQTCTMASYTLHGATPTQDITMASISPMKPCTFMGMAGVICGLYINTPSAIHSSITVMIWLVIALPYKQNIKPADWYYWL